VLYLLVRIIFHEKKIHTEKIVMTIFRHKTKQKKKFSIFTKKKIFFGLKTRRCVANEWKTEAFIN
jgi:hypothetical protein